MQENIFKEELPTEVLLGSAPESNTCEALKEARLNSRSRSPKKGLCQSHGEFWGWMG